MGESPVTSSTQYTAVLTCHPETHSQAAHGIDARVSWIGAGALALHYALKGDIVRLRIPPPQPPRRADYLWQHTCFEAFVSAEGQPDYCEFNFSPSGEWAVYSFRRYREGAPLADAELAPKIATHRTDERLELNATIQLPRALQRRRLRLGLCGVIEGEDGILSYWALKHPPGKADFHHPDGFALEIAWPETKMANQ
jgi:hypothetical protein